MEDPTVRRLTKKIFPYLWLRHKLLSSIPSGLFPFSEMTVFSEWIGNAVIIYLHSYRPTLSKYLEKHIPSMPQSKIKFWEHVAFLCLQIRLTNDDVFDYFLTTCAITAEVALHCYMNGYDDVLSLASVFFCAFFENELCEGFHEAGGWDRLQKYVDETSCKELYELVDEYVKELSSPRDRLPILITVQYEQLAAARREKLISLLSLKIGEIEREDQTNKLVSRIFHWHFMENHRISEVKPGILKRMGNIRHKKTKSCISMDEGKHEESLEVNEIKDFGKKISNVIEPLCLQEDMKSSECVASMFGTRFKNKTTQTLDDLHCKKVNREINNQRCTNNKTAEKIKLTASPSLRELRDYYENLSTSSERKVANSKYSRKNNGIPKEIKPSAIKESVNTQDKIKLFESYSKYVPNFRENVKTLPKSTNCTSETMINLAKSSHTNDALSDFTNSFQELGFRCLCIRNSPPLDEKLASFANYAGIMEKCQYFQSKYPSMEFVILIPDDYFINEASHAPEKDKCEDIISENKFAEQQFSSTTKQDFENLIVSRQRPHSQTDKNQIRLANGLALSQDCTSKNNPKSKFFVTKVDETDLSCIPKTSKISRFSVTKVNENQMVLKDERSLLGIKCTSETKKVPRFKVTGIEENYSKETTKISRFTVTKVNENYPKETTKISRFTVTKVNENQLTDGKNIFGENWKNGTTKKSRFTVMKVSENEPNDVDYKPKKYLKDKATKISRFSVRKVYENETISNAGTSLRKSCLANMNKISRFEVTGIGGMQANFAKQNYSINNETLADTENEALRFDNSSVQYEKRVSFNEHPYIAYYHTYSSDDSFNSITSSESLNRNTQDSRHSTSSGQNDKQNDILNTPILRNPTVSERRTFFRFSSGENQSTSDNTENSNTSSGSSFINKLFRRSSSRKSKMEESSMEKREEMDEQKIEQLKTSLEEAGPENPVVFKI